jgi:hypothetical protein
MYLLYLIELPSDNCILEYEGHKVSRFYFQQFPDVITSSFYQN